MDEDRPVIYVPSNGETLKEYLQRYSDVELREIIANPELLRSLSETLQQSFRDSEQIRLENLCNTIEHRNNFEQLQRDVETLGPVRRRLLKSLKESEDKIKKILEYSAYGRIVCSTFDIAGTIGGMWLKESGSPHAKWAFGAATGCGLLGLVSTTSASSFSKDAFDELMLQFTKDKVLMDSIRQLSQQFEEEMNAVFPFDVTDDVVRDFSNAGEVEFTPITLLSALLRAIQERDAGQLRNEELIRNLINFTLHPTSASQDWFKWINLHRHPVMLDIARIILQLQTGPSYTFALCQSIPALPVTAQNILSLPVWGRIALNMKSMYDTFTSLRSSSLPTVVSEIRRLREQLESEMIALEKIVEFVRSKRNGQR